MNASVVIDKVILMTFDRKSNFPPTTSLESAPPFLEAGFPYSNQVLSASKKLLKTIPYISAHQSLRRSVCCKASLPSLRTALLLLS